MYQAVEGDNKIPVNSTHLRLFEGWFVPWGRAGFFYVGKCQTQIRRPTPGNNINQNLKPPQNIANFFKANLCYRNLEIACFLE